MSKAFVGILINDPTNEKFINFLNKYTWLNKFAEGVHIINEQTYVIFFFRDEHVATKKGMLTYREYTENVPTELICNFKSDADEWDDTDAGWCLEFEQTEMAHDLGEITGNKVCFYNI